jgi:hypothetical protein
MGPGPGASLGVGVGVVSVSVSVSVSMDPLLPEADRAILDPYSVNLL